MIKNRKENGVSTIIGVILLVAIVIILAAVVGILALGFGDNLKESSTAAVTVDDGKAKLVNAGNSEKIIVKTSEGSIKGNLTKAGETINVNSGDSIISVTEGGSESILKKVKGKDSSSLKIVEDFEEKSSSDLATASISGNPEFSVENRGGSDWANISLKNGETGAIALSNKYSGYLEGSLVGETSSVGANPYVGIGNGTTYVQTIIRNGRFIVEDSNGNQDSVNLNNRNEKKSQFKIDYSFEEGSEIQATLTTNSSTYSVSTTTSINDLNSSHQLFGIGSANFGNGSGNVYFKQFKTK